MPSTTLRCLPHYERPERGGFSSLGMTADLQMFWCHTGLGGWTQPGTRRLSTPSSLRPGRSSRQSWPCTKGSSPAEEPGKPSGLSETGDQVHPPGPGVPGRLAQAGGGGDQKAGCRPVQAVRSRGEESRSHLF